MLIVRHGISLHPHVLLSTPDDDEDTYISLSDPSPGLNTRWSISILVEEYSPMYFPSSEDEYGVPTKALQPLYPVKLLKAEAVVYTFDPVDALQDVNVREEKERMFVERLLLPSRYTPPPQEVAEQDVKFNEERVSL